MASYPARRTLLGGKATGVARVLILEDDELLRQTLETVLSNFHQVSLAASAESALEQAQRESFDLLLTDVRIGGAMDGVEALEALRKIRPQMRSIIMTGFSDQEVPMRAARLQADDYLLKPFRMPALLDAVQRALDASRASPPLWRQLGRAASQAVRWLFDSDRQLLQEQRQRGMKEFFLLLRARRLSRFEAQALFTQWEQLELDFLEHDQPTQWPRLIGGYKAWCRSLQAPEQVIAGAAGFSDSEFERLYNRVLSGFIEVGQLLRAVELLHVPQARRRDVESYCTFHWLWGQSTDQGDPFVGQIFQGYRLVRLRSDPHSLTRLYDAEASQLPDVGDRVLSLLATAETEPLLAAELAGQRVRLLATQQGHHFLLYPSYAMSLRSRLPREGLPADQAWQLLRPLFLQVAGWHRQQRCSGCFGLQDVDWPPAQSCILSRFPQWTDCAAAELEQNGAPELLRGAGATPRSDQAVLGRLLFEVCWGSRLPDSRLRLAVRWVGEEEADRALLPYWKELGWLAPLVHRLCQSEPEKRFADLSEALTEGDRFFAQASSSGSSSSTNASASG